ncbi:MAG: FecR domain-containing protein [Flavisolibacter sp.]
MNSEDQLSPEEWQKAKHIAYLIAGYIQKKLTIEEQNDLDQWVASSEENIQLFEKLTDEGHLQQTLKWYEQIQIEKALTRIKQKTSHPYLRRIPFWRSWRMAAAVLLFTLIGFTLILVTQKKQKLAPVISKTKISPDEILPGTSKALLTLSNGKQLILEANLQGTIAREGETQVIKTDSLLFYHKSLTYENTQPITWNTLSTPTGAFYQVVLADGTHVWLNAASSLHFPTAFTESRRQVQLTGEGYFEVAKDPLHPFVVEIDDTKIEVLGTHFNVNGYSNNTVIRTTLLEGLIKLIHKETQSLVHQGQEALVNKGEITIGEGDLDQATGWVKGNFVFHRTSLEEVLREIERWYSIETINQKRVPIHLTASFPRQVPLSKLLFYLERTGEVHFKMDQQKLYVLP